MSDANDISRREQRIRERAHQLWEQAGKPEGLDQMYWHEAESQIEAEDVAAEQERGRAGPPSNRAR